ncbi:unnamed protein product [Blepharisma stoltei]|uniref:Uncharacterized protein n=1 Tax=Blepharisma stoltei TaxID=1481888 RepID=A0AAU9J695_9CILI|nr:unnamed protein product [Blepharisma stoltei]
MEKLKYVNAKPRPYASRSSVPNPNIKIQNTNFTPRSLTLSSPYMRSPSSMETDERLYMQSPSIEEFYKSAESDRNKLEKIYHQRKYKTKSHVSSKLQNEINRLSKNFAFQKDDDLHVAKSLEYIKQAIDKILIEKEPKPNEDYWTNNRNFENSKGKFDGIDELRANLRIQIIQAKQESEKAVKMQQQLKRYENILNQKESGLRDQEKLLYIDKEEIIKEKEAIKTKTNHLELAKEEIKKKANQLEIDKELLEKEYEQLEKNRQNIKEFNKFEEKHYKENEDFEEMEREFLLKCEEKSELIAKAEEDLSKREMALEKQHQELYLLSKSLQDLKDQIEQQQDFASKNLEEQHNRLQEETKSLNIKRSETEAAYKKLTEELKTVEKLKNTLLEQKEISDKEIEKIKEKYGQKICEALNMSNHAQETVKIISEKEEYIDKIILEIEKEKSELNQRWKYVENLEMLKEDLERERMVFEDKNALKRETGNEFNEKDTETLKTNLQFINKRSQELEEISNMLEEKMQFIMQKENELKAVQEIIDNDREEIDSTSKLLKNIFTELNEQREMQEYENEKIAKEKEHTSKDREKIAGIITKLDQEIKRIDNKEDELQKLRQVLDERENLLHMKERNILMMENQKIEFNNRNILNDQENPEDKDR